MIAISSMVALWVCVLGFVAGTVMEQYENGRRYSRVAREIELLRLQLAKRYAKPENVESRSRQVEDRMAA